MGKGKKKERSFIKHDSSTQNNDNAKKKNRKVHANSKGSSKSGRGQNQDEKKNARMHTREGQLLRLSSVERKRRKCG